MAATYTPKPGDRVAVTRTTPGGRVYRTTGTIRETSDRHGFALAKDNGEHSWYADAATMLRNHGVVQTVEPAPDDT